MVASVVINVSSSNVDVAYDYIVPEELQSLIKIGCRVKVPFGNSNRTLMGYVVDLKDNIETTYELKLIVELIDLEPVITKEKLELAKYIKEDTLCPLIRILNLMVPEILHLKPVQYLNVINYNELDANLADVLGGKNVVPYSAKLAKYSYKIKSLMELSNNHFKSYDSWMLPLRNRFINLNKTQLEKAGYVLQNIRQIENKRNYKRLSRETNDIAYEYVCTTTKVSKKLKKEIYAKIQESYSLPSYIDEFVAFTRFFKNKENINKVYYTMCGERRYSHHTYKMTDNVMKLWMSYRNEQYLSNLNKQDLFEKLNYMYDSEMLINRIRKVYGTDWDLNSIKFYNEQQLHDNLVRITNSEDFLRLYNAEAYEREIKPFEMEDDIFELENDTEIQIARNRATLTNIGQAMGICVGGYGGQVECGYCRIAYLKVNDAYEVCIELKKHKNPDTKKFEYTIVQAKLRYNELVGKKEFYYNIVKEWADKHNISIDTYDMKVYDENKIAIEY